MSMRSWMLVVVLISAFVASAKSAPFFSLASPPPVSSGLILHYDQSSVVATGSSVTGWNNLGSLGSLGDLSAAGPNPTLVTGGVNGNDYVDFTPAVNSDLRSGTFTAQSQPNTIFAVTRWDGGSGVMIDGITTPSGRHFFRPQSGGNIHIYAGNSLVVGSGNTPGQWQIYTIVYDGASSSIDINGTNFGGAIADVGSFGIGGFALGNSPPNGSSSGLGYNGGIAEVLVFDRLLTSDETNLIGYDLAERFGIASDFEFIPPPLTPEPSSLVLASILGIFGILVYFRRRRRH